MRNTKCNRIKKRKKKRNNNQRQTQTTSVSLDCALFKSKHAHSLRLHVEHPKTCTHVKLFTRTHHTGTDRHRQTCRRKAEREQDRQEIRDATDRKRETKQCLQDDRDRECRGASRVRVVRVGLLWGSWRVKQTKPQRQPRHPIPIRHWHTPPRPKKKITCTTHPREHDEAGALPRTKRARPIPLLTRPFVKTTNAHRIPRNTETFKNMKGVLMLLTCSKASSEEGWRG